MSEVISEAKSLGRSVRTFLAITGVLALLAGLVMLIWPLKAAFAMTAIIATYLIVGGIFYVAIGLFGAAKNGWARVGHVLLGLLYIVAGIVAFVNLPAATAAFALVTVVFIGVSWIFEGVVSLTLLGQDATRVWSLLYALLSIVAGILVLSMGLAAAPIFWLVLAISLVVMGVVQIIRAITFARGAKKVSAVINGEA